MSFKNYPNSKIIKYRRESLHQNFPNGRSPWSNLPRDLLHKIFQKLENPSDIYQCVIVCVSWKYAASNLSHFILLPNHESVGNCVLLNKRTKGIHTVTLPELKCVSVFSSSFGWLRTIGFDWHYKVCLLNPITIEQIKLPLS
ncbi:hypothetical protein Ddye_027628 [Dipteronia dyeriana]|uniref:F-box domain-containing protein n=1 Tax=Dipteronia dyeriana TaxID=168575 RepID=A0AAD9TQA5_9ROSI|nr:hypothetical protein Ddye_027628 [Dipteronia dyeriana]